MVEFGVGVYALSFDFVYVLVMFGTKSTHVFGSFEVEVVILKFNIVRIYGILGLCFILLIIHSRLLEAKFVKVCRGLIVKLRGRAIHEQVFTLRSDLLCLFHVLWG
jgi:hypothetical protein